MGEWNDIALIAPAGDIDIATAPLLREQLDALIDSGTRRILVSCQNVSFIDSTGLALLLSRARRVLSLGGLLSVVNTSAQVARFLQIARLIDVLHVSAADRPPVPVLAPGAMPLWSKTFTVAQGMEKLGEYRHRVSELLASLPMDDDARYDAALAVGEALSNAYDHAGGEGCAVAVHAYPDRVVIEVRDCGCGFALAADEELEASEERGRGIRLMRLLMDSVEVAHRRDLDHGTCVRLIKLLRK